MVSNASVRCSTVSVCLTRLRLTRTRSIVISVTMPIAITMATDESRDRASSCWKHQSIMEDKSWASSTIFLDTVDPPSANAVARTVGLHMVYGRAYRRSTLELAPTTENGYSRACRETAARTFRAAVLFFSPSQSPAWLAGVVSHTGASRDSALDRLFRSPSIVVTAPSARRRHGTRARAVTAVSGRRRAGVSPAGLTNA